MRVRQILQVLTRGEKKQLGIQLLLDIVISIADIAFLALLVFMIHFYTANAAPGRFSFLPEWLTAYRSPLPIAVFFLFFSAKNSTGFLVYRSQCRFLFRVASRISRNKLKRYQEGGYADYIDVDSSVHIREISYQPLEFCQHVLGGFQQIITQTVLIVLSIAAIIFFNARLFFLLLAILLPPVFAVFYLIKGRMRSVRVQARTNSERSLQHLQESLSGYVESNIYHRNEVFLDRYITFQQRYNKYLSDQTIVQGIPGRMIEIFALLGVVILIMINGRSGDGGNAAVTTIGVFMAAAYKIIPGIVKILSLSGQMNTYAFTLHNLATTDMPANRSPAGPVCPIRSVRFNKVRFSYNGRLVVDRPDLHMAPGDFLGIAGPSGQGKTTILNLLLGFLTPDEGEIFINERLAATAGRQQYWQRIAYVKQQPFLLHDTILYNITMGGSEFDPERLQTALGISGLSRLIDTFPEKLDKIITENGRNISGGQRQRIAIARALYKEADLIILDEPFTELDEESEQALLCYFQKLSRSGKLVVLITHNRNSLSYCNKILSLS